MMVAPHRFRQNAARESPKFTARHAKIKSPGVSVEQPWGVSKDTVYGWIAKKEMPAHKVGRLWKFKTDEVDDWVRHGKASDDQKESEAVEPSSQKGKHAGGEKADG